jgi:hypothetical protein
MAMALNKRARVVGTDLHRFASKHPLDIKDTRAFDLLYALDTGQVDWAAISDEDHFTPGDIQALLEEERDE